MAANISSSAITHSSGASITPSNVTNIDALMFLMQPLPVDLSRRSGRSGWLIMLRSPGRCEGAVTGPPLAGEVQGGPLDFGLLTLTGDRQVDVIDG